MKNTKWRIIGERRVNLYVLWVRFVCLGVENTKVQLQLTLCKTQSLLNTAITLGLY